MWFADVICDLDWFMERQDDLGTPRVRVKHPVQEPEIEVELLLYGGDYAVRHLRAMLHTTDKSVADACLDKHVQLWIHSLEVSSTVVSQQRCTAYLFPRTNSFAVVTGEGDETAKSIGLAINQSPIETVDYYALARGVVNWLPETQPHLIYLVHFLNSSMPPDARWLNGYRLAEWHFMRGTDGLSTNEAWRALLEKYRSDLAVHLRPRQTLHGLFEEIRAFAAHAVRDDRSVEERTRKPGDPVLWTFSTVEKIVVEIMNEPSLSRGLFRLIPRGIAPPP